MVAVHDVGRVINPKGLSSQFYGGILQGMGFGLTEERIIAQHGEIDELNEKLKPFKIFKSIECDILGDGTLDYSDNILSTFDLVITSIHSNLKMTEEKWKEWIDKETEGYDKQLKGLETTFNALSSQAEGLGA